MLEGMARAKRRRRMLDIEMRMHHRAAGCAASMRFPKIVVEFGFEQMRQQRVGEHQIESVVGFGNAVGRTDLAVLIIGDAGIARMVETKALRIVVFLAPRDRFAVDIDADIGSGKPPATEIIVAQPMRPAAAADPDIENIGIQVGNALAQNEHPEIARMHQEVALIVEDAIADADTDAQVIGRQRAKFRERSAAG